MTRTDESESEAADERKEGNRGSMADVDHTHPYTDETFAATGVYDRGEERAGEPADD